MNRHSILFKVNIIFAVAVAAVLVIAVAVTMIADRAEQHRLFERMRGVMHVIPPPLWNVAPEQLDALAESHGLEVVRGDEKRRVLATAEQLRARGDDRRFAPRLRLLEAEDVRYLYYRDPLAEGLFRERAEPAELASLLPLLLGAVVVLLSILYYTVRKSLAPIQELRQQIRAFGEGNLVVPQENGRRDEISVLYREFYKSAMKIRSLTEARRLFLRNIMHELNTPVAKGRLVAAMVEDANQPILENIFDRLDLLIRELANVEKISSGNYRLKTGHYRVIEIVDHAKDLLFLDDGIDCAVTTETITCDFEMMALAFKNLMDNSLKYGHEPAIAMEEGRIHFSSAGAPLEHGLEHYTEAFVKGQEEGSGGFGLGLYIVNEILRRQGFGLRYTYGEGRNDFIIEKRETAATDQKEA